MYMYMHYTVGRIGIHVHVVGRIGIHVHALHSG